MLTKREKTEFKTSLFELTLGGYSIVIINEICDTDCKCIIQKNLYEKGIRNLLLVPIDSGNDVLGILELASKTPRQLNNINAIKLDDVIQLLADSIKVKKAEFHKEIQAVIKENCTAIHPTVEWRFQEEAQTYLLNKSSNPNVKMKEIVFEGVYPLYGVSDIRHSSDLRNKAIQDDLIEQLSLAKQILNSANINENLPYIDELIYRVNKYTSIIKKDLTSRDEVETLSFLKHDIEPTFSHFEHSSNETQMKSK